MPCFVIVKEIKAYKKSENTFKLLNAFKCNEFSHMIESGCGFLHMTRKNSYYFSAGFGSPTEEKSEPASGRNTAASKSAAKEKGSR